MYSFIYTFRNFDFPLYSHTHRVKMVSKNYDGTSSKAATLAKSSSPYCRNESIPNNFTQNRYRKWPQNWIKHAAKFRAALPMHGVALPPKWRVAVKSIDSFRIQWSRKSWSHWSWYWTISIKQEKRYAYIVYRWSCEYEAFIWIEYLDWKYRW